MASPRENESIEVNKVDKSFPTLPTEDDNSEVNGGASQQQQPAPHQVRGITSNQGAEVTEAVNLDHQTSIDDSDRSMSSIIMPRRFACSRCFRCKGQSKGAPHCRVQVLHLFAPGWFEEDQSQRWKPPRGFIKWLRNEGPLMGYKGCEVNGHITIACKIIPAEKAFCQRGSRVMHRIQHSRGDSLTDQEVFDMALSIPTTLDSFPWYSLPNWGPENYRKPFAWEKRANTGGFHKEETHGSDDEGGDVTKESPPSATPPELGTNASKGQQHPSFEAREDAECLKDKRKATSREPVEKEVGSVGFSSSSSSSSSTFKDSRSVVEGGLVSLIEQSHQEMKINVAGPDAEVGGKSGGGSRKECTASVDLEDEGPRGSSDNSVDGVEAGHSMHADVDIGGGAECAAARLPAPVRSISNGAIGRVDGSGGAIEAATVLGGSGERRPGDEDGRQRKLMVEAGGGVAASVSATQPTKSLRGGIVSKQRAVGTRSVRGRGCAEGARGSTWKGVVSVQDMEARETRKMQGGSASKCPPDKAPKGKEKKGMGKEGGKDGRREKDQPAGRKVREVVKVKAKEIRERRKESVKKSAALKRREHLAYWVKNRPFLGAMPRKQNPAPLVPQDLYRNALLQMQKLDERRKTETSHPPEPTPIPAASISSITLEDQTESSMEPGASDAVGQTTPLLTAWREETLQSLITDWPAAAEAAESAESDWSKGKEVWHGPQITRGNKSAPVKRVKDLNGYYQKNELMVTMDSTRKALKARLHYWIRDIPLFVERGGMFLNAEGGIPVDMSAIKTTPDPAEWGAWAGKSFDTWKGLVPFTTEDFPKKPRNRHTDGAYHEENDSEDSDDGSVVHPNELFVDKLSQPKMQSPSSRQRRGSGQGVVRTSGGKDVLEGRSDPRQKNSTKGEEKKVDAANNDSRGKADGITDGGRTPSGIKSTTSSSSSRPSAVKESTVVGGSGDGSTIGKTSEDSGARAFSRATKATPAETKGGDGRGGGGDMPVVSGVAASGISSNVERFWSRAAKASQRCTHPAPPAHVPERMSSKETACAALILARSASLKARELAPARAKEPAPGKAEDSDSRAHNQSILFEKRRRMSPEEMEASVQRTFANLAKAFGKKNTGSGDEAPTVPTCYPPPPCEDVLKRPFDRAKVDSGDARGGAAVGGGSGGGKGNGGLGKGDTKRHSPVSKGKKFWKISGKDELPPGWTVEVNEPDTNRRYPGKWYMYKREGTKSPKNPRNVEMPASLKPVEAAGHRSSLLIEKEKSLPYFAFRTCVDELKEKGGSSESIDETLAAAAMVAMEKELRVDTTKNAPGAEELSATSAVAANKIRRGVTGVERTMAAAVPPIAASSVVEMELRRLNSIRRAMGHKVSATATAADEELRGVTPVEKTSASDVSAVTSAFDVSAVVKAMVEERNRLTTVEKGSSTATAIDAAELPTTKMAAKKPHKPHMASTDTQSSGLGSTGRVSSSSGGDTAVTALEAKAKGFVRNAERMNESSFPITSQVSVSGSLEQKRKVAGFSPRSAGGDKRSKLEANKLSAGSSSSFSVGGSPSAVDGSGCAVGKKRRGRPLGSKNKPKDKDNVKDKKGVKGSGVKAGGGVKNPMVKAPRFKTAGSSGMKISGLTCIPPKASVGADGKVPGSTVVMALGTSRIKRPESIGTKTQNSRAGLIGRPSGSIGATNPGSIGVKSPGAVGVKTSGPKARIGGKESCLVGVRAEGSKCARTSGPMAGSAVRAPGPTGVGTLKINAAQSSDVETLGPKEAAGSKSLLPPGGKAAEPLGVNNQAVPATGEASDTTATSFKEAPSFKEAVLNAAESIGVEPPKPAESICGNTTISSSIIEPHVSERKAVEMAPGSKSGDNIEGDAVCTDMNEREPTRTSGSSVRLATAKEKQAAVLRDSMDEKALGALGQEASRPPSRDISCVPCVSEGDAAREKNASSLSAEDLMVTSEMERQTGKMACWSEYAEMTHMPQDKVEDSSDGWSEGDKIIGEVEDACVSKIMSMAGEGGCGNDATREAKGEEGGSGSISSGEIVGMEVERQKEKGVERREDVGCMRRKRTVEGKLGSKAHRSESTVCMVTDKEVDGTSERFSSQRGSRSVRTFADVTQASSLTKSFVMSPMRRRKRQKSSVDEHSTTGGSGSGNSGSHIEDGKIKEKNEDGTSLGKGKRKCEEAQEETKEDDEETKEESGVTVPETAAQPQPLSSSSSRKGAGKKIGKVMKNRVRDLAAGAILPVGNRRRRAASLPGGPASTAPSPATASTSRGAATSVRRRRSVDGSRGADVGGGSSVTRSSRDRNGSGGDKSSSSGSSVPLRHSSRAAAAAATAALTGVFSSPYSS